jgi:hypothetical protein
MGQTFVLEESNGAVKSNGRSTRLFSANAVSGLEAELDEMRAKVCRFAGEDPADVLAIISGLAGRLAEIRAALYRDNSQRCTQIRLREVDPLRDDLDLQFKIHSRRIALMEWELRLAGGGT